MPTLTKSFKAEVYECQNNVIGDNVVMNNYSVISPHTIQMDNTAKVLTVQLGDRSTLLPRSGVYGGTKIPQGTLLGSHCRPFRGQNLVGDAEYNDTPCTAFLTKKAEEGLSGLNRVGGGLFSDMEPLTKPQAIEIIRETLANTVGGKQDGLPSLPNPTDSTGMEEIQLDSLELVEFVVQLKRKFHVDVSLDALLSDLVTVSDVADALLGGELEQLKDEGATDNLNFDVGVGFEFHNHETVQGNN